MGHSEEFDKIKEWYDSGAWSIKWVRNAVRKGRITTEEFEEITGEPYEG